MVRKSIPPNRAKRGFIPSGNPTKDRARMVHALIQHYKNRIDKDIRPKLITKATEILEIGDADAFFSGKSWSISGITIFVYCCRFFGGKTKFGITYDDIRIDIMHFASGASFIALLKKLEKRFGNAGINVSRKNRYTQYR